jgi:hypothetical protein
MFSLDLFDKIYLTINIKTTNHETTTFSSCRKLYEHQCFPFTPEIKNIKLKDERRLPLALSARH